jgi:hypothetical protein
MFIRLHCTYIDVMMFPFKEKNEKKWSLSWRTMKWHKTLFFHAMHIMAWKQYICFTSKYLKNSTLGKNTQKSDPLHSLCAKKKWKKEVRLHVERFICSAIEINVSHSLTMARGRKRGFSQLQYHHIQQKWRHLLWYVCASKRKNWNFYYSLSFSLFSNHVFTVVRLFFVLKIVHRKMYILLLNV